MADQGPVLRNDECAKCRKLTSSDKIKMCSGCKVMGYCSKECQKNAWKQHKPICKKMAAGNFVFTRPPCIKLADKIVTDDDVMSQVDGILIKALDLENHPENADKYAVTLFCRVDSTDSKLASMHLASLVNGREPPPLPEHIPKLFQMGKAKIIPNNAVSPKLNEATEHMRDIWRGMGHLKPGDKQVVIRAMWVSEEADWATCYCPRLIVPEMIQEVASWRKPRSDGEGFTHKRMSAEDLIKLFNLRAFKEPESKKKLTMMVSTKE